MGYVTDNTRLFANRLRPSPATREQTNPHRTIPARCPIAWLTRRAPVRRHFAQGRNIGDITSPLWKRHFERDFRLEASALQRQQAGKTSASGADGDTDWRQVYEVRTPNQNK